MHHTATHGTHARTSDMQAREPGQCTGRGITVQRSTQHQLVKGSLLQQPAAEQVLQMGAQRRLTQREDGCWKAGVAHIKPLRVWARVCTSLGRTLLAAPKQTDSWCLASSPQASNHTSSMQRGTGT